MWKTSINGEVDRGLPAGVKLLGDRGYVGCGPRLITPFKRPPGELLEFDEWLYNATHGWFRSPVEHFFAYIKRFAVLGCEPDPPHTTLRARARTRALLEQPLFAV